MTITGAQVFRDFETDGVPSSGAHQVDKSDARAWALWVETVISASQQSGGFIYTSKAAIDADLAHGENSSAWVLGDATADNNGVYQKSGASGSGAWAKVADLPYSVIPAEAGGSANAITLTTAIPVPTQPYAALVSFSALATNTSTVTLQINGGSALALKDMASVALQAGDILVNSRVIFAVAAGEYRLMFPRDYAALAAQASAARDAAQAAQSDAEGSASSAAGSEVAATLAAASAAGSAAAALAAAMASGEMTPYATKSAANSALAGLANGKIIQVIADESRNGRRTVYQVVSGAYVFLIYLPATKSVYYDPSGGSDSNSGLYPDAAKATLSAAVALMAMGDTLRVRAQTRTFGELSGLPAYSSVDRYGYGENPIFDQSRLIPTASWVADPTYAGVWYADVSHEVATTANGDTAAESTQFRIFEENDYKPSVSFYPYYDGADIAANRAFISNNHGYFTCHKQGSTVKNPRTSGQSSQNIRYYIAPTYGTDPTTGDYKYYYAENQPIAVIGLGSTVRNMIFQRSGNKDATGHSQYYADTLENIIIRDVGCHGWVGGAMCIRNSSVKAHAKGGSYLNGRGGGWHLYLGANVGGSRLYGCESDGFEYNYFAHGASGYANNTIYVEDCKSRNSVKGAINFSATKQGNLVDGFESYNDISLMEMTNASSIKNFRYISSETGGGSVFGYRDTTGGSATIENGSIIIRSNSIYLAQNDTAQETSNSSHECTLAFINVSRYGGSFNASTLFKRINYVFTDSIIGEIELGESTTAPFLTLSAVNCHLSWWHRTLDEIQSVAAGVGDDCLVPYVGQTYECTIVEGDLGYTTTLTTVSASNAGDLTELTQASNQFYAGDQIKITNPLGSGDIIRRVVSVSGSTLHVDTAVGGTFSSKSASRAYFARKVFADDISTTMVLSANGAQGYLSDATGFSQGTSLWIGSIGRRDPIGIRKITALSGQTITFDRPVEWQESVVYTTRNYAAFGSATGVPRPSVNVQFKFPLRGLNAPASTYRGPNYTIAYTGALALANRSGEETGSDCKFSNIVHNLNASGAITYYGTIRHERGYIDAGLCPIGVGDTLTISAAVYVTEFTALWDGEPFITGQLIPRFGSELAKMRIGALSLWQAL